MRSNNMHRDLRCHDNISMMIVDKHLASEEVETYHQTLQGYLQLLLRCAPEKGNFTKYSLDSAMEASCSGRQAGLHCSCHQRSVALLRPAGLLPTVIRPAPLVANSQLLKDQRNGLLSAKHNEARIMQTHALPAVGEVGDVEEVAGVRVVMDNDSKPAVEYLVRWKVRSSACNCLLDSNDTAALTIFALG